MNNIEYEINSKIWKSDSFINSNIPFIFNDEIIEYDMKEAGFSLTKEYKLLDEDLIKKLSKYKKERRTIELGLIQRNNEEYRNSLKQAFAEARSKFFIANNIDITDLISIKKDAIFTKKLCRHNEFGRYIIFRPKNYYTSYIQLGNRLECYYNPNKLDIKGIGEDNTKLHEEYMIKFIKSFIRKMETEKPEVVIDFTKRFITQYKRKEGRVLSKF